MFHVLVPIQWHSSGTDQNPLPPQQAFTSTGSALDAVPEGQGSPTHTKKKEKKKEEKHVQLHACVMPTSPTMPGGSAILVSPGLLVADELRETACLQLWGWSKDLLRELVSDPALGPRDLVSHTFFEQ